MSFLKKLTFISIALFSITLSYAGNHKGSMDDVQIKVIQVQNGIYMLMGKGGNIGLSTGTDGVFMIDDQFAPLTQKIKKAVSTVTDQNIKFVLNTHWHFDHTGGNENLGKAGVVIVSHDNVRKRMSKDNFIKAFNKKVPASSKVALPVITFNDSMTFHMNDETIEVIHKSKAHTDGDSIVFFKSSNVIHTGDVFFNGFYPFIDESSEGSITGMINAATYIISRADDSTKIIPGHGKLSNKQELIKYRDTLIVLRDRMKQLIQSGKSLDEIVKLQPNKDIDKIWGGGFLPPEKFLTILYGVVKKEMK